MEYDLLKYRGFQADETTSSMKLLYFYSKYKKDREDDRNAQNKGSRVIRMSGGGTRA